MLLEFVSVAKGLGVYSQCYQKAWVFIHNATKTIPTSQQQYQVDQELTSYITRCRDI